MGYICDIINEFSKKSINHTSVTKCLNQYLNQGKRSIATTNHNPLICICLDGNSSVDRALAFQAGGRGFESRFPL